MSTYIRSTKKTCVNYLTLFHTIFLFLVSVLPANAAVVREPYLQLVTPNSVTVVWRTDLNSANNSRVQYGTTFGSPNQTATGTAITSSTNSNVKDHIVTITGLNPSTTYYYNVGTVTDGIQAGGTNQHFFKTAPPIGSTTSVRAWILGDAGDGSDNQRLVRDAMLAETAQNPPNFVLHMGDMAYWDGTDAEFTNKHFAIYKDILRHTALWPTLGNHESPSINTSLGIGPYYEAHVLPANGQAGGVASGTEAYYSFDYANVHFIVLDSMDSSRALGSPMLTWLQDDLAATDQEWLVAFFHHPPYSKGGHDSDSAVDSGGRMIDMRETILPLLEAGGVDLVLTGHSHAYERSFLLDGAYGYGTSPTFVTPPFETLLANGHILDSGDGNPAGNGAYQKHTGGVSNDGAVYVVAGHGGCCLSGPPNATFDHPVMAVYDMAYGSVLMDINGSTITLRNLRAGGTITDTFAIEKNLGASNLAPNGVINTPSSDQSITVGQSLNFTGTGTDPDNHLPLSYHWNFGAGSGIPDATVEDPGAITFNTAGVFTVTFTVTDALGLPDPTPATVQVTVTDGSTFLPLDRTGWTVWVNSEETSRQDGRGINAIDGNASSIWHTRWSTTPVPTHPHSLVVDLGAANTIRGFRALPRQDTSVNGQIGNYEFLVKTDSSTPPTLPPVDLEWTFVTSGSFPNTKSEQEVLFGQRTTRYVWLRALSEAQGTNRPWTSLAEFNVLGTEAPNVPPPLDRSGWNIWVNSEEISREDGRGINAIDGNTSSIWHTRWSGSNVPAHPHSLIVDLGAVATIEGIQALPRQDTSANGQIGNYELYVKTDSSTPPTTPPVPGEWTLVTSGSFPNSKAEQLVLFAAKTTRYVWLRALNEVQGTNNPWTSLAEFNVLGTLDSNGGGGPVNQPPNGVIDTPSGNRTISVGQSINFTGTGTDPDNHLPLTYHWNFGTGSGIPDATVEDPGSRTFNNVGVFTVTFTVTDALGLSDPSPPTVQITVTDGSTVPPPLSRSGWNVWVNSEETSREDARGIYAIDGNASTIWHTRWSGTNVPAHPHSLIVGLGAIATIEGIRALPRQDTYVNGQIGNYELYVKTDSSTPPTTPPVAGEWTLVTSGSFPNTKDEQQVLFAARTTRYVWLRALSEVQGTNKPWTSLAEFNVLGTIESAGLPPPLDRSGWNVWVNSEETSREDARGIYAIDGNASTIWHTRWSGTNVPAHPHSLIVDLGAVATIEAIRALPRQDTYVNGQIGNYELYVKTDSSTPPTTPPVPGEWTLVNSGAFPNTKDEQQVVFAPRTTRYVWLRALSEIQGTNKPWTSLAEFNVLGTLN